MCNRASRYSDYSDIKVQIGFDDDAPAPNLEPRWNLAPTQQMLVAVHGASSGKRVPALMHWGLIPSWSTDGKQPKFATFNAKSEELENKKTWREPWLAHRRCLVIVDAFYEWEWLDPKGKQKQPYAIARTDGRLTVMAGLWNGWRSKDGSQTIRSCTIITVPANELMAKVHNHGMRMPAILEQSDWPVWLGEAEGSDTEDAKAILRPAADGTLKAWTIGREIGSSREDNNYPSLLDPKPPVS